jgi:hypothetical protein
MFAPDYAEIHRLASGFAGREFDKTALYIRAATKTIQAAVSLHRDCSEVTSASFMRWDTRLGTSWKTEEAFCPTGPSPSGTPTFRGSLV